MDQVESMPLEPPDPGEPHHRQSPLLAPEANDENHGSTASSGQQTSPITPPDLFPDNFRHQHRFAPPFTPAEYSQHAEQVATSSSSSPYPSSTSAAPTWIPPPRPSIQSRAHPEEGNYQWQEGQGDWEEGLDDQGFPPRRHSFSSGFGGSGSPSGSGGGIGSESGSWIESASPSGSGYGSGSWMSDSSTSVSGHIKRARAETTTDASKIHHCPECGATFTTSGHRTRHMRLHSGEKQYACLLPQCPQRFTRKDNMKQHFRTHVSTASRTRLKITPAQYYALLPPSRPGPKTHHLQDVFEPKASTSRAFTKAPKHRVSYGVHEDVYRLSTPPPAEGEPVIKTEEPDFLEEDGVRRTSAPGLEDRHLEDDLPLPNDEPPLAGGWDNKLSSESVDSPTQMGGSPFYAEYRTRPGSSSSSSQASNPPSPYEGQRSRGFSFGSRAGGQSSTHSEYGSPRAPSSRRGSYQSILEQMNAQQLSLHSPNSAASPASDPEPPPPTSRSHSPLVPNVPPLSGRSPIQLPNLSIPAPELEEQEVLRSASSSGPRRIHHGPSLSEPGPPFTFGRPTQVEPLPSHFSSAPPLHQRDNQLFPPASEPVRYWPATKPRSHSTPQPVHTLSSLQQQQLHQHQQQPAGFSPLDLQLPHPHPSFEFNPFEATTSQASYDYQRGPEAPLSDGSVHPPTSWLQPSLIPSADSFNTQQSRSISSFSSHNAFDQNLHHQLQTSSVASVTSASSPLLSPDYEVTHPPGHLEPVSSFYRYPFQTPTTEGAPASHSTIYSHEEEVFSMSSPDLLSYRPTSSEGTGDRPWSGGAHSSDGLYYQ